MRITTIYYLTTLLVTLGNVTVSTITWAQTDSLKKEQKALSKQVYCSTKVKDLEFINPKVYNFGFKQCGNEIATTFQCYNQSLFPLELKVKHPSVLKVNCVDTILQSNAVTNIAVAFSTKGLRLGLQSLELEVEYKRVDNAEDTLWQMQPLFLDGYLEESKDIHFAKTTYELDTVWIDKPYTIELELSNRSSRVMRVYGLYCYENCKCNDSLPLMFKAGDSQKLSITFTYEKEKEGWFDAPLFINTNAMLDPYELRIEGRAVKKSTATVKRKKKKSREALE